MFWVPLSLVAALLVAGLAAGAYFVGQGTRLSGSQVTQRVSQRALADQAFYQQKQQVALQGEKLALFNAFQKRLTHATNQAFHQGQQAGYSSGQAAGFSAGQASGLATGQAQGRAIGRARGRARGFAQGFNLGSCFTPGTQRYIC
jgi:uncharacterized protein HemX